MKQQAVHCGPRQSLTGLQRNDNQARCESCERQNLSTAVVCGERTKYSEMFMERFIVLGQSGGTAGTGHRVGLDALVFRRAQAAGAPAAGRDHNAVFR